MTACSLSIALLITSCSTDTLRVACGAKCYPDDWTHPRDVGICAPGRIACEHGEPIGCEGATGPGDEICDGLDNDCDGFVDEIGDAYYTRRLRCPTIGVCAASYWTCRDGAEACQHPDTYEPVETRCDGIDNDCDGLVDENTVSGICYSGPVGTERPPCRPGWLVCRYGAVVCEGESLPMPERCDGVDNDCDGSIDEGTTLGARDVIAAIDVSGSMGPYLREVVRVVSDSSARDDGVPDRRWGVISIGPEPAPYWWAVATLGSSQDAQAALANLSTTGGTEPTYDAIWGACRGSAGAWSAPRRILLAFGDEPAQSVRGLTESDAIEACTSAGVSVYVWTLYRSHYQALATATGGAVLDLETGSIDLHLPAAIGGCGGD